MKFVCLILWLGEVHGSHFFGVTNFPDFSSILKFFFYLKYGTIFAGFSLLLAEKFP